MTAAAPPEPVLFPEADICDAHHHLWHIPDGAPPAFAVQPRKRYLVEELMQDAAAGHRIVSTVFVEAHAFYRSVGDPERRSLGETEFAAGQAAMADSERYGPTRACAAIVCAADLRSDDIDAILEAHARAGGGRLRGVRQGAALDPRGVVPRHPADRAPGLYLDPRFRKGFERLAPHGLSFDAWVFHPQIGEVEDLARAFPDQPIILDHLGAPLRIGAYAQEADRVFDDWRAGLESLAACRNVSVKVGGMGMATFGFGFDQREAPASSEELADAWRPFAAAAISAFGPDRCLFESNFPVDARSCDYRVLWNALKRIAADYDEAARTAMLRATAERVYGICPQDRPG